MGVVGSIQVIFKALRARNTMWRECRVKKRAWHQALENNMKSKGRERRPPQGEKKQKNKGAALESGKKTTWV